MKDEENMHCKSVDFYRGGSVALYVVSFFLLGILCYSGKGISIDCIVLYNIVHMQTIKICVM